MAFTVNLTGDADNPSGNILSFGDDAIFRVDDNGVLVITQGQTRTRYAPHAWFSVEDRLDRDASQHF